MLTCRSAETLQLSTLQSIKMPKWPPSRLKKRSQSPYPGLQSGVETATKTMERFERNLAEPTLHRQSAFPALTRLLRGQFLAYRAPCSNPSLSPSTSLVSLSEVSKNSIRLVKTCETRSDPRLREPSGVELR